MSFGGRLSAVIQAPSMVIQHPSPLMSRPKAMFAKPQICVVEISTWFDEKYTR